jgi:hypothetical protein
VTLRDLQASHAKGPLTNLDMLGELVTYVFKSGESRIVRAVVNRIGLQASAPNVPQVAKLRATVSIPRDATVGIVTFTPGDRLVLAMRLGEAPVTVRAKEIIAQDEGMLRLEVEA